MSLKSERDLNPNARGLLSRAKAAEQTNNLDYAINLLQACMKEEPLFLDGRRFLRYVEIKKFRALSAFNRQMISMKVSGAAVKLSGAGKKEPAEQLALAEEVLAFDPFNAKANSVVGDAGAKLGHLEFRAFAYETLAQGKEKDKMVLIQLADTYMELQDFEKAEKTYTRILEIDPRDGDALSGLKNASAAHSSRSGGWEKSGSDYRNALKSKSEAVELEQAAKVVKSDEAIDEQIRLNFEKHQEQPENPVFSRTIAQLFQQKQDLDNAIVWYQEAFRAGHGADSAIEKTIDDLKLKKAENELAKLQAGHQPEADPEAQAKFAAAVAEKQKEINEVRLSQAKARVQAHPNDGEFRFQYGEALYWAGEFKRATEELQMALKQPSVRYQALNYMGLSFMARGMMDFAVKQLSLAESELPVMDELKKEIVYNLGTAYERINQAEKSLEQWKKIYEVDMGYRDVAARVEASYG